MNTSDTARTRGAQTGSGRLTHPATGHGWRRFLRHYLEMVAAMLIGMMVLGAALRGVLAVAGLEYPTRYPELMALEMAFTMSVGMVAWMRHRGHGWTSTLEMVGAMVAPAVALVPLLWLGLLAGDSLLMAEHVAMFALMFLVMLRRRDEYGGASHG
jgi:hypothetical protein